MSALHCRRRAVIGAGRRPGLDDVRGVFNAERAGGVGLAAVLLLGQALLEVLRGTEREERLSCLVQMQVHR